ncbi:hypothetical protein QWM81_08950 [Streptomyces ficellus]|uniref:Class I SAM-dependent methyltransferase n=1 Tax=Streptomyces ficellus TaxID=1977088 RepID=A0ABT7Z3X6_9ACTN|nr:hypothetical protein [Streptomyces ficellus]MDN3294175.1 hypothetical protein [Streptomyces ficellus]
MRAVVRARRIGAFWHLPGEAQKKRRAAVKRALTGSLELLRPGGRFVELGKQDIYDHNTLPL